MYTQLGVPCHNYVIFKLLQCIHAPPNIDDVWFSLNGTTYQNNSVVTLEDINSALHCVTNLSACCGSGSNANWFFPNGTKVPSTDKMWDFYRTRGQMVVRLFRRRGGVDGIYRCEITDSVNVTQTIYIGVYTASNGE